MVFECLKPCPACHQVDCVCNREIEKAVRQHLRRAPTDAQRKLLTALALNNGGVFDRYYRIVSGGEVVTKFGSTTLLTCFRYSLVKMDGDRVVITDKGRAQVLP